MERSLGREATNLPLPIPEHWLELPQGFHRYMRAMTMHHLEVERILDQLVEWLEKMSGDDKKCVHCFLLFLVDIISPGYES